MKLSNLTLAEASKGLKEKKFSSLELTQDYLDRINKRNNVINAYITVTDEEALRAAKLADKKIASGKADALCGIPFGVKDSICVKGIRSTAAAKILDNYIAPYDATVVQKIRNQGGVLVGKHNCDAFGHGASNENSMYGTVQNPLDTERVAGGSSGGSAAAVADDQCVFAIAEDTGGSIRQPASFCGVVGLRPSYGRNSRFGVMPMASSLDTVGPIAQTVEDIALIMENIAGQDPKDATTVKSEVPHYREAIKKGIKGLRIGLPKEYFEHDGLDTEVHKIIEKATALLKSEGAELVPVSLPHTKYAIATYYIIVPSEDSSNLARLDGIRYGNTAKDAKSLQELYSKTRNDGFPREVKRRIMVGAYCLSAGYYDQYYRQAQKVRTRIIEDFTNAFNNVDVLVAPTSPFPAFKLGEKVDDILAMYLADAYVSPAALAGLPALSVPAGFSKDGLPIGMQIIGPRLQESLVMQVGHQFELLNK